MTRSDGLTLVEFWAAWCRPCLTFLPVFEEASDRHPEVTFATVDTQAEVTLTAELSVSGVPTIRAYCDGIQVMDHSGPMAPETIDSVVRQLSRLDRQDLVERAVARQPLPDIGPA